MLTLPFESALVSWPNRPSACLLRKFSSVAECIALGTNTQEDVLVCLEAVREQKLHLNINARLLYADNICGELSVFKDNNIDRTTTRTLSFRAGSYALDASFEVSSDVAVEGKWRQLLLLVGCDQVHGEPEHRNFCLSVIRAIRCTRPAVYAQFLSWQKPFVANAAIAAATRLE